MPLSRALESANSSNTSVKSVDVSKLSSEMKKCCYYSYDSNSFKVLPKNQESKFVDICTKEHFYKLDDNNYTSFDYTDKLYSLSEQELKKYIYNEYNLKDSDSVLTIEKVTKEGVVFTNGASVTFERFFDVLFAGQYYITNLVTFQNKFPKDGRYIITQKDINTNAKRALKIDSVVRKDIDISKPHGTLVVYEVNYNYLGENHKAIVQSISDLVEFGKAPKIIGRNELQKISLKSLLKNHKLYYDYSNKIDNVNGNLVLLDKWYKDFGLACGLTDLDYIRVVNGHNIKYGVIPEFKSNLIKFHVHCLSRRVEKVFDFNKIKDKGYDMGLACGKYLAEKYGKKSPDERAMMYDWKHWDWFAEWLSSLT